MGALGSDSDETQSYNGNSDIDVGDTQHLEFDSQYSPFPGEENDDILYGLQFLDDHQPLGDTVLVNDAFETQRLDFDCETQQLDFDCETQQVDFDCETQQLDFDCETQQLDFDCETQQLDFDCETQPVDQAEETQVMDFGEEAQELDNEGDCVNNLETQLLSEVNEEETVGASDEEDSVGTEVLTDTEDTTDIDSLKRSTDKAVGSEGMQPTSFRSQAEAESKSIGSAHSMDAARSSGSVRQGFTSIRTASLRNSGLLARKKSLKNAESGDATNQNGVKSSGLCDDDIDQESDMRKTNEYMEGLSNESCTKLGKSAARKLVLDDIDVVENEHEDCTSGGARGEDLVQAHSCTNDSAGLSYVNSQEPGDLSQANALDFVEQFLKVNVCDFDLGARQLDVACGNQNPTLSAKGTQKLAKKVNLRCSLAENLVYDWDDRLEDEGGGEFLTRNKERLFGKNFRARKSLTEPQKPKHLPRTKRGTHQKSIGEECQSINARDTVMGKAVSEPKFTAGRKADKIEKLNINRNLNEDFEKQLCTDFTTMQVETEAVDPVMLEMDGVGVDTQMAAEAMESLSRGITLPTDGENAFQGEDCRGQMKDKMKKKSTVKQSSIRKRVRATDLGVTTRPQRTKGNSNQVGDESKRSVASERHPQNAKKQVVEGKATGRIKNTAKITKLNAKGLLEKKTLKVKDNLTKRARERNLDEDGCAQTKKRCIEKKINSFSPIASRTRKDRLAIVTAANTATELSDDPKTKLESLKVANTDGNKRKRKNGQVDTKTKALTLAIPRDGIHCNELNHSRGGVQNRSVLSSEKGKSKDLLEEFASCDPEGQSITRKRRSNRIVLPRKQSEPISISNEHEVCCSPSAEKAQPEERLTQGTPKEMAKSSLSVCTTPVNLRTPINTASPVCMGDEYYKLSCKKNLTRSSLMKELNSLTPSGPKCSSPSLRKRRDMASIRVLFSHHLDDDIIRHQKKILARLGVAVVSSISDATHFVTDEFVRTRNMLEAIAHSKPVVNHSWLESCGQAGCYIDEKNYILRDAKKEKELGFSMPVSMARATQHPLLEGRRVLITPNTKPGVEILSSLVKAVHGQAFERICRSIYEGDKLQNGLLVLSCEEDYEFCVPLLKKGAEVYSAELLLNGIVIQKLEFGRHRLFMDQVKKTRSTIWLKENGNGFHPVTTRP